MQSLYAAAVVVLLASAAGRSSALPTATAAADEACAKASLAECLVSATTTRTCALRVSSSSSWTCTPYPQTAPPSEVTYDMGFAKVLLSLSAARNSTRPAALAALARVTERCLPPSSLYTYSALSLHLDSVIDSSYLHLMLAVHAGSNITGLADAPSQYVRGLRFNDEFLKCARGAAEPEFDVASARGVASGRCGNGVVEDGEQCDSTPYCNPETCACESGSSHTPSGTCAAIPYCTLVTGYSSRSDAATDAPKFAAAYARCFDDSDEITVSAEVTRVHLAPQVRIVVAGVDPAGLHEGARLPTFFYERDMSGGHQCFNTGAASLVVAGRKLYPGSWAPYDQAHPWGDDSNPGSSGSAATMVVLLALPLTVLRLALGAASN
eukprot:m51a1_g6250 hypothetical protein (381) ;mRNA; r:69271-70413